MKLERIGVTVVVGAIAALTGAGCGEGAHSTPVSQPPPAQAGYQAPSQAQIEAFTKRLSPLLDRSPSNVRVINLPGGVQRAEIDRGFRNVIIARRNPDGTLARACVDSEEQAQAFLAAPPAPRLEVK